ncbi:unnamed protein product, partial [Closterium sp. Yama58-4]
MASLRLLLLATISISIPVSLSRAQLDGSASAVSGSVAYQPSAFEAYMQERWRKEELLKKDNPEEFAAYNARELSNHMLRRSLASGPIRKSVFSKYSASPEELEEHRMVGRLLREKLFGEKEAESSYLGRKLQELLKPSSPKRRILAQPAYMELYEMADFPQRRKLQGNSGKVQAIQAPDLGAPPARGDLNITWFRWQSVSTPTLVDWSITPYMTPMLNQQFCESCWAMTATDLVSIVWAQINNQTAELLSTQHACDCSSSACCRGGWPEWVFQFIMANGGVASNADYPYAGMMNSTCASVAKTKLKAKINGWEKVPARSNMALMKAVAQHPCSCISRQQQRLINYSGGIFFGQCSGEIDHAVVVVGYSLVDPNSPVWILKNTWGPSWGEGGYMRLPMLADGPGKCNMLSERGLYPTFYDKTKGSALCKLPINPCGGGTCVTTGGARCCNCPPGYVERLENDAPKCTVATPCDANPNPCGYGTCYNEFDGSYTCACPAGSVIGSRVEGSMTCVLGTFQSGLQTYTILLGDTCQTIASTFGFTVDFLQAKNPFLDCSQPLTPGYVILVAVRNQPTLNCNVSLQRSQTLCVAPGALSSTSPLIRSCGRVYNVGPAGPMHRHRPWIQHLTYGFRLAESRDPVVTTTPSTMPLQSVWSSHHRGKFSQLLPPSPPLPPLVHFQTPSPPLSFPPIPASPPTLLFPPLPPHFLTFAILWKLYPIRAPSECSNRWQCILLSATYCPFFSAASLIFELFLSPPIRLSLTPFFFAVCHSRLLLVCYPPYLQIGQKVCVNGTTQSMTKYPLSPNVIPYSVGVNDTLASISQQYASMCPNNTFPADICSSNSFPDCTDQSITPSQMILIPCTRKIAGDICADSLPVCGADYVTYKSVCHAVLSFALPLVRTGPCNLCNEGICQNRTAIEPIPNTCPAPPGMCPFPTWPLTPDYFYYCPWLFKSQCDCLLYTCDYLCNRTAAYYKYTLGSKYALYRNATEEDDVSKLDVPCACSGSLKYAHHDCIQRWCNEKGNTQCEICHHPFKEGYTAPPPPASPPITPGLVALQFRDGSGQLSHIVTFRDAVTGEELRFGLEDFASAPAAPEIPEPATVSCLKSLIIIVLLLIFARHFFALVLEASGDDDDVDEDSAEFTIFLMQLLGILLPCFILARALAAIHERYRQEFAEAEAAEAATRLSLLLQSRFNTSASRASSTDTSTHTCTCTHTHAHTHTHTHAHAHTHMHMHTHTCTHTHTHTCTRTHTHAHAHTHMHTHTHTHMHTHTHTCTCTHTHAHTCKHAQANTHMHIHANMHKHTHTCTYVHTCTCVHKSTCTGTHTCTHPALHT